MVAVEPVWPVRNCAGGYRQKAQTGETSRGARPRASGVENGEEGQTNVEGRLMSAVPNVDAAT